MPDLVKSITQLINDFNSSDLSSDELKRLWSDVLDHLEAYILAAAVFNQAVHAQLVLEKKKIQPNLEQQVLQAWKLAVILGTACQFLGMAGQTKAHLAHEKFYRELLNQRGGTDAAITTPFDEASDKKSTPPKSNSTLHLFLEPLFLRHHLIMNILRLFALRLRRLFTAVRQFIGAGNAHYSNIKSFETTAAPIFLYLGWAFFVPRLLYNLGRILKTPSASLTSTQPTSLDRRARSQAMAKHLWFQLAIDIAWFVCGLLTCFLLVGSLLPIANFLILGLQIYTLFIQGIDALMTFRRLSRLTTEDPLHNTPEFKTALAARHAFEKRQCLINLSATLVLCVAALLTTTLFINPIIACTGAALLVAATLFLFIALEINRRTMPKSAAIKQPSEYTFSGRHHLFQSAAEISADNSQPLHDNARGSGDLEVAGNGASYA